MNSQGRPATLQDVADLAGVSRSTVSSILNGARSSTRTSEATRERIVAAAKQLDYRPNIVARSLRHRKSRTIGFYNGMGYLDARNGFLNCVIAGMHETCDAQHCDLLIHRVSDRDDDQAQLQEILSGKVDGVVVWTHMHDTLVPMLAERNFPVVAIADARPEIPSITADDDGGSRLIARRMAGRGHKHLLYRMPPVDRVSCIRRRDAFVDEALHLGMETTVTVSSDLAGAISDQEIGLLNSTAESRPTAIACWCDANAFIAYQYLHANGMTGHSDNRVDLIGFDGFSLPNAPIKLTTIAVPWDTAASAAVDTIVKIIAGEQVPPESAMPVQLIEGTTG